MGRTRKRRRVERICDINHMWILYLLSGLYTKIVPTHVVGIQLKNNLGLQKRLGKD